MASRAASAAKCSGVFSLRKNPSSTRPPPPACPRCGLPPFCRARAATLRRARGWRSSVRSALAGRYHDVAQVVGVHGLHLEDARVVGAGRPVGAFHQFHALGKCRFGGGGKYRIQIVVPAFLQRELIHLARPGGDVGGHQGGLADLFRGKIVAVGVTGALAGDHPHADPHGNALSRAFHHGFVDADGTGQEILEVEIRVIAALRQRFREVPLEVVASEVEAGREDGIGKLHTSRLSRKGRQHLLHRIRPRICHNSNNLDGPAERGRSGAGVGERCL